MIIVELILIGANKDGATYILSGDKEKIVIPSNKNRPINVYELCKKYTDVDSEWINPSPIYFYETSDDIIHLVYGGFTPIDIVLKHGKFMPLYNIQNKCLLSDDIYSAVLHLTNLGLSV